MKIDPKKHAIIYAQSNRPDWGHTAEYLAEEYGVSVSTIRRIWAKESQKERLAKKGDDVDGKNS